jgi:thioredoxin-like negative regulator of GroEL
VIPDRAIVFVAFLALIGLAALAVRLWVSERDRRRRAAPSDHLWDALDARPDGRPTVIAFSTPACAACKTAQLPALRALVQQLGPDSVRVIQVDAATRPAVAERFGILTVPTTVVLTGNGRVATTNNGFAPAERLARQVQAIAAQ